MVLLVWGIFELSKRWRQQAVVLSTILAVLTVACIARTRDEIQYWTNDFTVWGRAVTVTQNNFMAHYMLGVALWQTTLQTEALNELQTAVSLKPDFALAQKFMGSALAKLQIYPDALDHFNKGLAVAPHDASTWYNCAIIYYDQGRLNDALSDCRKSLAIETNSSAQMMASQILQLQAQAKQQNADLRAALEKNPDRADVINNLAWFLATSLSEDMRNGNEAIKLAIQACQLSQNDPVCVATLAAAYAEAGQFDNAISTADQACSLAEKAGDQPALKGYQQLRGLFRMHQPAYGVSSYNNLSAKP
jgi:tetratricopeptide (TPR) repeat protein